MRRHYRDSQCPAPSSLLPTPYIHRVLLLQLTNADSLLLTEVQNWFRFPSFYLMSFLCSRTPPRRHGSCHHVSITSSRLWLRIFLFWWPTVLRSTGQVFCRLGFVWFFVWWAGVMCSREESHRGEVSFSSYCMKAMYYQRDLLWLMSLLVIYLCWCLSEGSHCVQPTLQGGVRLYLLEGEDLRKLFGIFLHERFDLVPHLLTY